MEELSGILDKMRVQSKTKEFNLGKKSRAVFFPLPSLHVCSQSYIMMLNVTLAKFKSHFLEKKSFF